MWSGRKLVKVQSCCRKVGPSIFVKSLLVKIVVQLVKRLLPLMAAHHSLVIASGDLLFVERTLQADYKSPELQSS